MEPEIAVDVVCVNPKCDDYGVVDRGNVIVRRRYGADSIRFLRCRQCRTEFSERHSTPLFGLRVRHEKIVSVVSHLAEGTGIRKTSRLTGVSRDAVGRIVTRVGRHAKKVHDLLVRDLTVPEVQMDEMWSFVEKKGQELH
jgi:transposase-like protein